MITTLGFHIELTNICTLKCPLCERTKIIEQYPRYWKNHSIKLRDLERFIDIDITGLHFLLCGQYGDPIYHPEFLDIVQWIKQHQASIMIHTNGSYKEKSWWEDLGKLLDHNDTVVFSIDGDPDNFTRYRINADWPSIQQGIEVLRDFPVKTQWKYIVFNYNEDTIEKTMSIAKQLGINEFVKEYSDRFTEDSDIMPQVQYIDPRFFIKDKNAAADIMPRCRDGKQHYISADGYYMPCCHMGTKPVWHKTMFGQHKKDYDIKTNTLSGILAKTKDFYDSITTKPLFICKNTCSSNETPICNQDLASTLN